MTTEIKANVTFEDIAKLDIRVGEILSVEDVPESKKLLKLKVDFGSFERQILVGMKGEREDPSEIVGLQALFVVNMKPKKMAGLLSEGMLYDLGYEDGITPVLAVPEKRVPNGTRAG